MQSVEQNIQKIKTQMDEIFGAFMLPTHGKSKDAQLPAVIDHTYLNPDATAAHINQLCQEAEEFGFGAVCVPPSWVSCARDQLKDTQIDVATVVGFPLGYATSVTKTFETKNAIEQGATEIDMVIHQGHLQAENWQGLYDDIQSVVTAAAGKCVKVIIETANCNATQLMQACLISQRAGADFVKTSTGFASRGADLNDIELMRQTVGPYMGIKASGGIQTLAQAEAFLQKGATRIGASRAAQWFK